MDNREAEKTKKTVIYATHHLELRMLFSGDPASIIVHVFKGAPRNTAMSIEKLFGE